MATPYPVAADDFSSMDDDALAAAVSTLAAHIHAATYRLLALIAELDRREVWAAQGALSCAHWLSWACGIDTHTAREKVRVARALTELPLLSEALAKGELGYSKVRALTRIATSGERSRPPQHRTARHRAACGEVRPPPSPREARRGDRAGRCPARESRPHLLARGRRHRGAARAVSAGDGRARPERARCGDGGACGGAAGGGMGQRRFGAGGRPSGDVSTRHVPRRCNDRFRCSGTSRCPPERRRPGVPDRRPTWDVHPWTVTHGAPCRCAGVDGRAAVRAGRCPGACIGPA